MKPFPEILNSVNSSSIDNGAQFIDPTRKQAIIQLLADSNYNLIKQDGLSIIYKHKHAAIKPAILISCHIDSLYTAHFHRKYNDAEILGTFDNSICNALLVDMMSRDLLPSNVIIAFTGNEEHECLGVNDTIHFLMEHDSHIWDHLALVITLDITSDGYEMHNFTVENYFIEEEPLNQSGLHFESEKQFKNYLKQKLNSYKEVLFINSQQAGPDESWEYDEYDLNCFSFCLPTRPIDALRSAEVHEWMHNDKGIVIKEESIVEYPKALLKLINGINTDLADIEN